MHKWRCAAGRNADDKILQADRQFGDGGCTSASVVFRPFNGAAQGRVATGNNCDNLLRAN